MNNLNSLAIIANIVGSSPGSTSLYEISCLPLIIGTLIVKTIVSQFKILPFVLSKLHSHRSHGYINPCVFTHATICFDSHCLYWCYINIS